MIYKDDLQCKSIGKLGSIQLLKTEEFKNEQPESKRKTRNEEKHTRKTFKMEVSMQQSGQVRQKRRVKLTLAH